METAAPLPDLVLWRSDRCHLCEETAELLAALFAERASAAGAAALGGLGLFLSVIGLNIIISVMVVRLLMNIL